MGKRLDLKGQKFSRLYVIEEQSRDRTTTYWKCLCDCGNESIVPTSYLTSGNTRSCGCLRIDNRDKIPDLSGQIFGRLIVIQYDRSKARRSGTGLVHYWICKCECGKMKSIRHHCLTRGTTKSCGCLNRDKIIQRSVNPDAAFNRVYRQYIHRCEHYNISFDLTVDHFYFLTQQDCYYCGASPSKKSYHWAKDKPPLLYNGVDRKDSNVGYTMENSVTCCTTCNYAKNTLTVDEFRDWIYRIYHFQFDNGIINGVTQTY